MVSRIAPTMRVRRDGEATNAVMGPGLSGGCIRDADGGLHDVPMRAIQSGRSTCGLPREAPATFACTAGMHGRWAGG